MVGAIRHVQLPDMPGDTSEAGNARGREAVAGPAGVRVREADESDAAAITDLFRAAYGGGYVHPEVYDTTEVKRMIFQDSSLVLVADDPRSGRVLGTAGVLFEMGAYTDLVGEFGLLVVDPGSRGRGIGHLLMEERLARVGRRLHMGFVEVRVGSEASPRISQSHGFVPVGALPQKLVFSGGREHAALLVHYFGDALSLRKNHPRIIPEAHWLADVALRAVGFEPDTVVVDTAAAYPAGAAYRMEALNDRGYSALLRIERGRLRSRDVYGPQRLSYGLFRLAASRSEYVVARENGRIVGALGFMRDPLERSVRVFEVIHSQDDVVRPLFEALERRCAEEDVAAVEVDVGADATRMQRTLLEMGYLPAAYVPAMAFRDVERVDVVKMYRLRGALLDLPFEAPEPTRSIGRRVVEQFAAVRLHPRLAPLMHRLQICSSLTEEQSASLVGAFGSRTIPEGMRLFDPGDPADEMYLVVEGRVRIHVEGGLVGVVSSGECLGEVSFLNGTPHAASATAETPVDVGVLGRAALEELVRRRPDIGSVVYRNLARGLGEKLLRADGLSPPQRP
jgi:CRP-like cAMP-binding protein/GNAT superfamily N-acetyltransferase